MWGEIILSSPFFFPGSGTNDGTYIIPMSRFLPSLLTYSFIEPCGCSDHCETKFMGGFSLKHNFSCEVCFGCTFILSFAALFAKMYIYTIKT